MANETTTEKPPIKPEMVDEHGVSLREAGTGTQFGAGVDQFGEFADRLFRRLGAQSIRDLTDAQRGKQTRLAYLFYLGYPLAYRGLEIIRDFVVGEGITFRANDPKVRGILKNFWNDAVNRWDLKQFERVLELSMFGELFLRVFINKDNGSVRIGYIDPDEVSEVRTDPENIEIITHIKVERQGTTTARYGKEKWLTVIQPNQDGTSDRVDLLEGEVFVFQINKVSNATRGNSDLLSTIDWLQMHEEFLMGVHEAASLKSSIFWDVTMKGASEKDLKAFARRFGRIKKGMIRFHNESVTIEAVSPNLNTSELGAHAELIKRHIATGLGIPPTWLGEDGANKATACYSEDTEVLTENGWKKFQELGEDECVACFDCETSEIQYHVPTNRTEYLYQGKMAHFHGKRVDVLVTPNHRMMVKDSRQVFTEGIEGGWQFYEADKIPYENYYFRSVDEWESETCPKSFLVQNINPHRMLDWIEYDGSVWCLEVPTGAFVTRRGPNKAATIQGNSEMAVPTTKRLRSRQRYVRAMFKSIFNFVIDQAIIAKVLDKKVDRDFEVITPPIWAIDMQQVAAALVSMSQALLIAEQQGWISNSEAGLVFRFVLDQLGMNTTAFMRDTESDDNVAVNDIQSPANPDVVDALQKQHIANLAKMLQPTVSGIDGRPIDGQPVLPNNNGNDA